MSARPTHGSPGAGRPDLPDWLRGLEPMRGFFDARAADWDERHHVDPQAPVYRALAAEIPPTDAPIRILDLGCGTGAEWAALLERAPRARITGIDVSPGMLAQAAARYADRAGQLELIEASYVEAPLGEAVYDFAVSALTVHHLPPETKRPLYEKVRRTLRPGGRYVEADTVARTAEKESLGLHWYRAHVAGLAGGGRGEWNYNMPLTVETQTRLLAEAGFASVTVAWTDWYAPEEGTAVLVALR